MNSSTLTTMAKRYQPTKQETVYFDPTSIGLPKGWTLTDFSDLKG